VRERKARVLEVSVDGAGDGDGVVLGKLALARTRSKSSPPVTSLNER